MKTLKTIAMTMTAGVTSLDAPATVRRDGSIWHRLYDTMIQSRPRNAQDEIAKYLENHQYDLPPELWIELERRRC